MLDLITPFQFDAAGIQVERRIVGGLLGHWAVWTQRAVELLKRCHAVSQSVAVPDEMLRLALEVTDCNAAFFDPPTASRASSPACTRCCGGRGCWRACICSTRTRRWAPGRLEEIDRVYGAYPHLNDDAFVAEHLDEWMG